MIFTLLSWGGGIMVIIGFLLIIIGFVLVEEEGPYKTPKDVLFGDSFNNLIAGIVICIIGFIIMCIEGQFYSN